MVPSLGVDDLRCVFNALASCTAWTDSIADCLERHGVQPAKLARAILRRLLDLLPEYVSLVSSLTIAHMSHTVTVTRLRHFQNLFASFRIGYALDRLNIHGVFTCDTDNGGYYRATFGLNQYALPRCEDFDEAIEHIWSNTADELSFHSWRNNLYAFLGEDYSLKAPPFLP
jgi:hypothetical protein